jgi:hypothetical protein
MAIGAHGAIYAYIIKLTIRGIIVSIKMGVCRRACVDAKRAQVAERARIYIQSGLIGAGSVTLSSAPIAPYQRAL